MAFSQTWPTIEKKENENPWVSYFKSQVYDINNVINSIWVGDPGSGKSWGMLSMAEALDPDFTLDGNWYFNAAKMFKDMSVWIKEGTKPGKLWFYDEAGIDLNALNWHDNINRGFNAFFQTCRHRNYIFACSVPHMNFVAKGVRTLMNVKIEANGWTKENMTRLVPRVLQYNGEFEKFYKKRLLIKEGKSFNYCNQILMPKPSSKLRHEYESLKKEFTANLLGEISGKLAMDDIKKTGLKPLTQQQIDIITMFNEGKSIHEVAAIKNIDTRSIYFHMTALKRKGIVIIPVRKDGKIEKYDIENFENLIPQ